MTHAHEYHNLILSHLEKVKRTRPTPEFKALQAWQANRLLNTHMALYEQPRFRPAMDFFKDELYSAEHFHRRNDQLIRALPLMCRTMPASVLDVVVSAAELHGLSLELDALLLHYLGNEPNLNELSLKSWVAAYRACQNPVDRARQLDLIELLGTELKTIVRKPMIRSLLSWATVPARLAGYDDIHQFVCRGYDAFDQLDNPDDFLIPVLTVERQLSDEWFSAST
ncbi:FFLEELY motif protein [Reinekea blandensis]|uniref:DUF8198 domain-containing protein n=1 Tax=Reinekea blandensis MED297 TaxID=314283 RepID=A4BH62_9GAMM|nr:hypothetical protein [Reinekea blandensis]EAR08561.1 hypothetical protein MED297_15105 [Reinekea sp. MED297] [Reinekea blandensis MED297]